MKKILKHPSPPPPPPIKFTPTTTYKSEFLKALPMSTASWNNGAKIILRNMFWE